MKPKYVIIGLILLLALSARSQKPLPQTFPVKYHSLGTYTDLKIGDIVPDFEIPKIIFSPKRSAKISDFKDQLLIVDFWSINCSGCVEGLPRMNALQKQFGNRIKILPVTWEEEPTVLAFWKTNKYTKSLITLPSVIEDKNFSSYFQHESIPHEVWINKGKVIGITGPEYVDAYNIKEVLAGKIPNWPIKNDFYAFDGSKQPLFTPDSTQADVSANLLKYVAISGYAEKNGASAAGLYGSSGTIRDSVKKTVRVYFVNWSIYLAYYYNLQKITPPGTLVKPSKYGIGANEVDWEVSDKSKYNYIPGSVYYSDWIRDHAICFESVNPDSGQNDIEIAKTVIADIDRLLGLNVHWEKRKEKVLVLVRSTTTDKLKTKTPKSDRGAHQEQKGILHKFRNSLLQNIPYNMNAQPENPYVFDETGYTNRVDMDLNIPSWTDIAAIRKAIAPYGLDLKEEEREINKLVFKEINGSLLIDGKPKAITPYRLNLKN